MTPTPASRRIVVLGASGAVGTHLVDGALDRGHDVVAIVRSPERYGHAPHPRLTVVRGDVHRPESIADAVTPDSIVVSGLGLTNKRDVGTLTAGARSILAAHPAAVVWLGAVGTGRSSRTVSRLTHRLLRAGFGPEYDDKVTADGLVLDAGQTVVHAGPMNDREGTAFHGVPLDSAAHRFFPHFVPRRAVAQIMLTAAEGGAAGSLLVTQPVAPA